MVLASGINDMIGLGVHPILATAICNSDYVDGYGRATAQTAAIANLATYTVGSIDSSFQVMANVNITSYTAGSFGVNCVYTDETNTSRTLIVPLLPVSSATPATTAGAAGAFMGLNVAIRCKAGTNVVFSTSGTFTTLTYNVEAGLIQTV